MSVVGRRSWLAWAGAGLLGGAALLSRLMAPRPRPRGSGRLAPDPERIIDLPAGFRYQILERAQGAMDDGYRVPGLPDAMGAFSGAAGTVVLMRNHELDRSDWALGPGTPGQAPAASYDRSYPGGVTRIVVDLRTSLRRSSNLVLAGTARNCAGGLSPWGWLSCEETVAAGHGYTFLCPTDTASVAPARRITAYGRFRHEAAAVDPRTHVAYLTEDQIDGCFYRFVPDRREEPFVGRLQALRAAGRPGLDTGRVPPGRPMAVEWVDIDVPDPEEDTVRVQATRKGAAVIRRGEGLWLAAEGAYFCSTVGGPADSGQIFLYDPRAETLVLVAQSTDRSMLDMPDNITVAPWGEIFMAEDGGGEQYVRVLGRDGNVRDFARNAVGYGELAGLCFSPDGSLLFVNIQDAGLTLAIRGPFPEA